MTTPPPPELPTEAIAPFLLRKRDDYESATRFERFLCDAYGGGGGFRGRIQRPDYSPEAMAYSRVTGETTYLDKFFKETEPEFCSRQKYSAYTNYCRPTTDLKVSYLMRKGWQFVNEPPVLTDWRRRTRFDEANARRTTMACVFGWLPVQVDMPAVPETARTAAEVDSKDPYLTQLYPLQLWDWAHDADGELLWAKTAVSFEDRSDYTQLQWARVDRITVWTRTDYQVWDVRTGVGQSGGQLVQFVRGGLHPFGEVPIVSWRASINLDDPMRGDSVMADVAIANRVIFNIESEERCLMRSAAFPLLVLPTKTPPQNIGESNEDYELRIAVEVGADSALRIDPDQKNTPDFISPKSDVFKTYAELKSASVVELYRLARVEYDKTSGAASSAVSKQQNFEQTNLAVANIAASIAHSMTCTLRIVGRGLGISEDVLDEFYVQAYDSYASVDLNADIEQAQLVLADPLMGPTFGGELRKRLSDRVLTGQGPDTRAKIHRDIDDAIKAASDLKAQQDAAVVAAAGAAANADAAAQASEGAKAAQQADVRAPGLDAKTMGTSPV